MIQESFLDHFPMVIRCQGPCTGKTPGTIATALVRIGRNRTLECTRENP